MNKNIKFILLLILVGIFAGFSGYLIKKNNVNDDLGKMNVSNNKTDTLFKSEIMSVDGEKVLFSKFEGKWLLINFWATWCAPCREEIPELNEFAHTNKDVKTIAIAIDDLESVNKFTKKIPINYSSFIAENEGVELSQSLGNDRGILPFSVIISPDKKIEKIFYGKLEFNQLNQTLKALTQ